MEVGCARQKSEILFYFLDAPIFDGLAMAGSYLFLCCYKKFLKSLLRNKVDEFDIEYDVFAKREASPKYVLKQKTVLPLLFVKLKERCFFAK